MSLGEQQSECLPPPQGEMALLQSSAAPRFATIPGSWFHFSALSDLRHGPLTRTLGDQSYVGFQTQSGKVGIIAARCSHMGANLGAGKVEDECIACPLHGWRYATDGTCRQIPSTPDIPAFAVQTSYPVEERGGHLFFFNRKKPRFPLPFFENVHPDELLAARPFELIAEAPWYFVGANGFDLQHFRMAHDRTLMDEPQIFPLPPYGRRIVARFQVSGPSMQDRVTRLMAGPTVTMDVTSWCGTMILVKARFRSTTSYGIFNVLPINPQRTLGRVIVWVKRSGNPLGQTLFDPLNAAIRRLFIQTFLSSDLPRIAGLEYHPRRMIADDRLLSDYLTWLAGIAGPEPSKHGGPSLESDDL